MAKPLVSSPMPRAVQLMLCTLVPAPFDDPDWIFEPKLDGLRVLCRFDGKRVTLRSRNDKSQDFQFPDVVEALRKGLSRPALLDGEIVCLDERGQSSFRALQQRFHLTDAGVVAERVKQYPAYLHVFDLLYYDRYDARPLPLRERKRLLKKAVKWSSRIRWTPITPGKGIAMLRETCRERGEGIVGKRLDSPYVGARSEGWVKIKCAMRQEFVIGGFTEPQRSRVGLGALLVGYYEGDDFVFAGKVGTGFDTKLLTELRAKLDATEVDATPFTKAKGLPRLGAHWVRPTLVVQVAFIEWTVHTKLRHPRLLGLRAERHVRDVVRETHRSP